MDYPYPNDPSHIACFPANLASRSLAHEPLRRERIEFTDPEKVFETWCNVWGDRILFKQIEYRKETGGVKHEFIYLRDLSLKEGCSPPSPSFNPPSNRFWPPELPWEPPFYERIQAFRCKLERTGHPEAQVNALDRTPAFDYIDFKENSDLTKDEQTSTVKLSITLEVPMPLKMALGACEAMCLHPEARFYTLQQFNCFFFSWTIIISVLRIAANWTELLRQQQNQVVGSMIEKLAMLGDAQNLWSDEENDRANMVLLISGECGLGQSPDTILRPLARNIEERCKNDSTWRTICASYDSSLWTDDRRDAVGGPLQQLLNEVADATSNAAVAGTGEENILSLFWRDIHIPLDDGWPVTVQTEFNALLGLYTRSGVWKSFGTALQQTSDEEANQLSLLAQSQSATSQRSVSQQIRSSPAMLGPRLALLGGQAALNGARAAADAYLNMPQAGEDDPSLSPLLQARHTLQMAWFMPGQIWNVAHVAQPFLSVLSARIEQHESNPGAEPIAIEGVGNNLLSLVADVSLRPEDEDQVVYELERSIKRMANKHPGCSVSDIRMATLELLIRLKERGKKMRIGMDPDRMWRLCLWYSLAKHLIEIINQTISKPMFQCRFKNTADETLASYDTIQQFIFGRIKNLSVYGPKKGIPGLSGSCQADIKRAITEIWRSQKVIQSAMDEVSTFELSGGI